MYKRLSYQITNYPVTFQAPSMGARYYRHFIYRNMFQGSFPSSFSNLKALLDLNLSHNNFSGQVPQFIDEMDLQHLDISFNNFEGKLPIGGVFENITAVDVRGNPNICGGPPQMHLPAFAPIQTQKQHPRRIIAIICIATASACLCTAILFFAIRYHKRP